MASPTYSKSAVYRRRSNPYRKELDSICVRPSQSHDYIYISFQRTLRIDKQPAAQQLPAFGTLPLISVESNAAKLPASITDKGGYIVPMWQREAFWINMKSNAPFAVRIFADGVNAVTGQHAGVVEQTAEKQQDYVVVPNQGYIGKCH